MISVKFYQNDKDSSARHIRTIEQHDTDPRKLVVCTANEIAEVNSLELLSAIRFLRGETM